MLSMLLRAPLGRYFEGALYKSSVTLHYVTLPEAHYLDLTLCDVISHHVTETCHKQTARKNLTLYVTTQ